MRLSLLSLISARATSRDLCDAFCVDFCYLNSKGARRRLAKELLSCPRSELQLLPYYARVATTLGNVLRDVGAAVVAGVEEEFAFLASKRGGDQHALDAKLRNVRFLGELTKFKLAPSRVAFGVLKACLDDFAGANVEVLSALLEACGRFLAKSPETAVRAKNMLDILQRLRTAKNLDSRLAALVVRKSPSSLSLFSLPRGTDPPIPRTSNLRTVPLFPAPQDNAYLTCRPPENTTLPRKERPPIHEYIRHLIHTVLNKARRHPPPRRPSPRRRRRRFPFAPGPSAPHRARAPGALPARFRPPLPPPPPPEHP